MGWGPTPNWGGGEEKEEGALHSLVLVCILCISKDSFFPRPLKHICSYSMILSISTVCMMMLIMIEAVTVRQEFGSAIERSGNHDSGFDCCRKQKASSHMAIVARYIHTYIYIIHLR